MARSLSWFLRWTALGVLGGFGGANAAPPEGGMVFIRDVRVFDGRRVLNHTSVLVRGGTIEAVGTGLRAPPDAEVVEGTGKTLLPGLIDAHVHYLAPRNLQQALAFGVTTELDMGSDPTLMAEAKRRQAAGWTAEADLLSAGALITAPGGHGTEYGLRISTITQPDQADALVAERVQQGSDYIKIILDSGRTYKPLPTLTREELAAVVAAAHRHGRRAIVHIGSSEEASEALAAGADGLAHLFVDAPPARDLARQARANHAFVVPTLVVMEKIVDRFDRRALTSDFRLQPYLSPGDAAALRRSFPVKAAVPVDMVNARRAVRAMRAVGVPILAGSDAGATHGPLLLRELELLVEAGLPPREALASATSAPAAEFGLRDRGEIGAGRRADLLLVRGDPTRDVRALRDVEAIWKAGRKVDRAAFAASLAPEQKADAQLRNAAPPPGSEAGLVSDFDKGTAAAAFGSGWSASSDKVAGGASEAAIEVTPGGVNGTPYALTVRGEIRPGFPFGFAGAAFMPGARPYAPANLNGKRISFWARGDGGQYALMVSARSYGSVPAKAAFTAAPEWRHYSIPLSAFDGMEGYDVTSLLFAAGPRLGRFSFQLDDVRID